MENLSKGGITISRKKWNLLGEPEKALAKKMGIKPTPSRSGEGIPPEESNRAKVEKRASYVLGVILECKLCNSHTVNIFNMVNAGTARHPCLEAKECGRKEEVFVNKWETRHTSVCKQCRDKLRYWPKEQVINQLITDRLCPGSKK